jgi:ZIP family zinc transporter
MTSFYLTLGISFIMGFSVFLSAPIIFRRKMTLRRILFYNAFAIGILAFLLLDIYGNVAAIFGNAGITDPLEILFIAAFVLTFLFFIMPKGSRDPGENPKRISVLAALGIGAQNLTEGLVFGSAGAAGILPIYALSAIGFTLQNVTEGFPIAMPLLGSKVKMEKKFIASVFLIGGMPTIIGTLIGWMFFSTAFIIFFDALASAAILYVVLVLFHVNINRSRVDDKKESSHLTFLTYWGILAGFAAAFVVNYLIVVA